MEPANFKPREPAEPSWPILNNFNYRQNFQWLHILLQKKGGTLYTTYLFITEVEYINTRDAYSQPLECRKCIKIKIQSYQS